MHDNLSRLGLDVLDVVNLRVGAVEAPTPGSIAEQVAGATLELPADAVEEPDSIGG